MTARKLRRVALDVRGLAGNEALFLLPGGSKRDPNVEAWLRGEPADLRQIARTWFEEMRACGDDVRELMHDGAPAACVGDAAFAYVNAFTKHVNVGFFFGATLDDPHGLLEGAGKRMRHIKLKPGTDCDAAAVRSLVRAAHADIVARLRACASLPVVVPDG